MGATPFERLPAPILDPSGNLAPGAKAYFSIEGTDTPLPVYQDGLLTTPHSHPVVANATARLPYIFLPYTSYKVRLTTSAGVLIFEADNCANAAPPDAGGGGGIVVTADQIFATGYIMPLFQASPPTGWVAMNGTTIGNAASGATGRQNADTENLFAYLWNNLANKLLFINISLSADVDRGYM